MRVRRGARITVRCLPSILAVWEEGARSIRIITSFARDNRTTNAVLSRPIRWIRKF